MGPFDPRPDPPSEPRLAGHALLRTPGLAAVVAAVAVEGDVVRIAGGAVRNALLGEPIKDVDLATTAVPDVVIARAEAAGLKVVKTGYAHGTVTVIAKGRGFEVTTLRQDVRTDGRRADVVFGRDWAEDASRRDFTMNALYSDIEGRLYDPLGGRDDCLQRRVRFIGDPDQRIREDYLRILRFFRFFAIYGGSLDDEGLAACARQCGGLARLSRERVGQEVRRLLCGRSAVEALAGMNQTGVSQAVFGVPADDAGLALALETGIALDAMTALFLVAVRSQADIDRLALALRLSNAERGALERIMDALALLSPCSDQGIRVAVYRTGNAAALGALAVTVARGGTPPDFTPEALARAIEIAGSWQAPVFPVKARDLIAEGLTPGPELGQRLKRLEDAWIAEGFPEAFASGDILPGNAGDPN